MLKTASSSVVSFFFLTDPATTEIYPLPLHAALPIGTEARRSEGHQLVDHMLHGVGAVAAAQHAADSAVVGADVHHGAVHAFQAPLEIVLRQLRQIGRAHV